MRARPRRPHPACRRVQLDLHAQRGPHRPLGRQRSRADPCMTARPPCLAAPRRRAPRHESFDRCSTRPASPPGSRPCVMASAPGGHSHDPSANPERRDRPTDLGGPRNVGDMTDISFSPRRRPSPDARADPSQDAGSRSSATRQRFAPARRGGPARRLRPRFRADARLLEPAGGDRHVLPGRTVRHQRPRPDGAGWHRQLSLLRRRSDERGRLPRQPAGGRGGAPPESRRRRHRYTARDHIIATISVPSGQPVDADARAAHCARHVARYKCLRAYHALETLPRATNGKLLRHRLREVQTRP